MPHTTGTQTLTLTGLRFDANLGILEAEKQAPQPIQVDAELSLGPQPLRNSCQVRPRGVSAIDTKKPLAAGLLPR